MAGSFSVFVFATTLLVRFLKIGLGKKEQFNVSIILSGIVFAFGSYSLISTLNMINAAKNSNGIWESIGVVTLMSSSAIATTIAIHKFRHSNSSVNHTTHSIKKTDRFSIPVDNSPLRVAR
jgi:Na+/melibiose symporter-like transporter